MNSILVCLASLITLTATFALGASASDANISKSSYQNTAALDLAQAIGKKQIVCGDRLAIKVSRSSARTAAIQFSSNEISAVDAQVSKDNNFYFISGEFDPPDTTVIVLPRGTDVDQKGFEIPVMPSEFDVMFGSFSNHTDLSSTDAHSSTHCVLK